MASRQRRQSRVAIRTSVTVALAALAGWVTVTGFAPRAAASNAVAPFCAGPDPFYIQLYPTAHASSARGAVELRFAQSPFGVSVTPDGHHLYDATVTIQSLSREVRVPIVWAATPSLDRVQKLGTPDDDGRLEARIAFNKFLVFVTAEEAAAVERWVGPILLRGISPSGRMHTMAGHGPFQGEPCSTWGFGPGAAPRD